MKRWIIALIIFGYKVESYAQCAMCKAGAEQSLEKGSTAANWINYAILFLMTIPLLLILGLYLLYRYNKSKENLY